MKKILLIILLISTTTLAQQNFYIDNDSNVYYQNIYQIPDSLKIDDISRFIKSKPNVEEFNFKDNIITAKLKNITINYQKYGGKYMTTFILLNHIMNSNLTVEFKEHKYRITINNITFLDNVSQFAYETANQNFNTSFLTDYVVKKNNFTKNKTVLKGLDYFNLYFIDYFTYQPQKDW